MLEERIVWRAMALKPKERSVIGVPFVVDDDYNETPQEIDGSVIMVPFEFSEPDFELLEALQKKQTEQFLLMDVEEYFSQKKIADLFSEILGDYMQKNESYQIKQEFMDRARNIIN